jgi:hypothetical protein
MPHIVHRFTRLTGLPLGKLCRSLLLPLLLLVAQQGALLHELSHWTAPETRDEGDKQRPAGHPCALCLAFAQVESTATTNVAVSALLADLSFAPAAATPSTVVAAELPSERNRGPPAAL